jgi:RNA polymerase sigma-70 factor (ECF subfamily)
MDISPEAVTRLWDEHSAALVLYARQWCESPEDVVQEAFLVLTRQAAAPDNLVGWIYRVVRNRAINAARDSSRRVRRETAVSAKNPAWFDADDGNLLDADAATEALRDLPADQREAIVARLWGGLSFEEIARLSDCSVSSAFRSYQRGLAALREGLGWSCPAKKTAAK